MSHRPLNQKRAARVRKAVNRTPLYARFDVLVWLRDRGYAQTNGAARALILDGRLKSESHTVGIAVEPRLGPNGEPRVEKVVDRFLPVAVRNSLRVEAS